MSHTYPDSSRFSERFVGIEKRRRGRGPYKRMFFAGIFGTRTQHNLTTPQQSHGMQQNLRPPRTMWPTWVARSCLAAQQESHLDG